MKEKKKKNIAIFIVPRSSKSWKGNEAGWITASGWASAGEKFFGKALVATTDGVFSPSESLLFPQTDEFAKKQKLKKNLYRSFFRRLLPEVFITAYKDIMLKISQPEDWPIEKQIFQKEDVKLIWQRHDLFSGPGKKLSIRYSVPLVTSVEALSVWEARRWGIKRPLWGKWLEMKVEAAALKESDLVCCVSRQIKEKLLTLGVEEEKIIITPNRVNPVLFHPQIDGRAVKGLYKLQNKFVMGWTGSFKDFHGLSIILEAFKITHDKYPYTVLMLVGDGKQFNHIKSLIEKLELNESVIMTGRKKVTEIPEYIANFDVGIVSAESFENFHYSPLKLREYLAVGKAVIAPNAGDLSEIFEDRQDLLFYEVNKKESLAQQIDLIIEDGKLREDLSKNAKNWYEREGSWDFEFQKVCAKLNIKH